MIKRHKALKGNTFFIGQPITMGNRGGGKKVPVLSLVSALVEFAFMAFYGGTGLIGSLLPQLRYPFNKLFLTHSHHTKGLA